MLQKEQHLQGQGKGAWAPMTEDRPWQRRLLPAAPRAAPVPGRPGHLYPLQPAHGSAYRWTVPTGKYVPDSKMESQEHHTFYQRSLI